MKDGLQHAFPWVNDETRALAKGLIRDSRLMQGWFEFLPAYGEEITAASLSHRIHVGAQMLTSGTAVEGLIRYSLSRVDYAQLAEYLVIEHSRLYLWGGDQ